MVRLAITFKNELSSDHLTSSAATFCQWLSKSTGTAVENLECSVHKQGVQEFCDRYQATCANNVPWPTCAADFSNIAAGSGTGQANTQACRVFHLGLAEKTANGAAIHCPHASQAGTGQCEDQRARRNLQTNPQYAFLAKANPSVLTKDQIDSVKLEEDCGTLRTDLSNIAGIPEPQTLNIVFETTRALTTTTTPVPTTPVPSGSCFSDLSSGIEFDAKLTEDKKSVVMTMSSTKGDWVGIGFKTEKGGMDGADMYIGSAGKTVTDRKATGYTTPAKDAEQNVDSSTCTKTGNMVTCEFQRKLVTDDPNDQPLDKEVYLLYATGDGDANNPRYHKFKGTTGSVIDVAKCVKTESTNEQGQCSQYTNSKLYRVHGFLMMLAWMLMLPFGIFLGATKDAFNQRKKIKTCRDKTLEFWFVIHRPLQVAGVLVMLIAFIIVFVANNATKRDHMVYSHHIMGVITFVLAMLQPIMAPLRKLGKTDKQKHTAHLIWHIIHAIFGYGAQILAFATVFLGIQYVQNGPMSTESTIRPLSLAGYIIVVAGYVIFLILGSVWSCMDKARKDAKVADPAKLEGGTAQAKPATEALNPWPMAVLLALLVTGSVLLWVDNFHPCQ